MKCSACKKKNADSYSKIVPGHELFETLQSMNRNQPYPTNSYFCGECLLVAAENLKQMQLLAQSNNVSSVNITYASSQSSNVPVPVPTKSSSNKENKPQPKRIKLSDHKPGPASRTRTSATSSVTETTLSQDYRPGPASRKRKSATSSVTEKTSSQESSQSSQSVAENVLLLNVESSTQSSQESVSARLRRSRRQPQDVPNVETSEGEKSKRESDSSSVLTDDKQSPHRRQSAEIPNISTTSGTANEQPTVRNDAETSERETSNRKSDPSSVLTDDKQPRHRRQPVEIPNISTTSGTANVQPTVRDDAETSNRESDSSSALSDDEQQPIVGPSAPAPKNLRIRQERAQMGDALRSFFQQGGQGPGINVNNYSRNLAG